MALTKLQQLFISASGCKGVLTPHMLQQLEYGYAFLMAFRFRKCNHCFFSEIIRRMTEEFEEDSGDYPLLMIGPQWKKFRTNFGDFLQVLCHFFRVYDLFCLAFNRKMQTKYRLRSKNVRWNHPNAMRFSR